MAVANVVPTVSTNVVDDVPKTRPGGYEEVRETRKTNVVLPNNVAVANEESKNRAHHSAAVKSVRTKKVIRTTTTVVHTGLTPLERELESIEGLGVSLVKPPAEVSGRVSVLTPTTASRAKFHPQLWQCFIDQTWPDKELVVVETYHTQPLPFFQRIAAQDERLRYVALQRPETDDLTVGAKRNLTVLLSSGQYCVNFDDDDLYANVYVERMVGELRKRSLVALTLSAWHNFFESNCRCGYSTPGCWEPEDEEEYEGILYGYGFSYVYLRTLAVSFPYPNLGFAEDAPFMLKLREKMGPGRVGLKEDSEGLCLHIVHPSSSTPDPEIETMLTEEELDDLEVSESIAFKRFLKRPWFQSIWSTCT